MFFLADIAFMLELFGFCMALMLIHRAKEAGGLVRTAGILLLIGSVLLAGSTFMGVKVRRAACEKACVKKQKTTVKMDE